MKDVIVFGGSGFLGSHVADCLTDAGFKVIIYDLVKSKHLKKNQKFIKGDICDKHQVDKAVEGKNIVYNFAGKADLDQAGKSPYQTIRTNILGNTNILESAVKFGVSRFIFASTVYVYSDSGSFYRSSKQACELIIEDYHKKFGIDFTILRYGSLYGPRSNEYNSVYKFLKEALEKGTITRFGDGEEIREYIHVYDAAHLSVKVLDSKFSNQYVIIAGNQKIKVKDLLMMIKEILSGKVEIVFKETVSDEHYEITPYNFSPKLAKKISDFSHVDLGQGILDLLNDIYKGKVKDIDK